MQTHQNDLPIIGHPDAGLILISYWTVQSPDLQKEAASLAMQLWEDVVWPDGLISHHVFGGHDGKTVMNYSQWRDDAAFDSYLASDQPERAHQIEAHPAGISRDSIDRFRLNRRLGGAAPNATPGCFVLVTFELELKQPEELVNRIVGTAQTADAPVTDTEPGDIASHFHINQDRTRVVNVAEFTDVESHERVVRSSLQSDSPVIQAVAELEGVTLRGFQRFDLLAGKNAKTTPHEMEPR
jgi:heme-degrading monooxygenase HmoA